MLDELLVIAVALPAEGVDRNELGTVTAALGDQVALPAEGVDRNVLPRLSTCRSVRGRPPRGGRG